MEERIRDSPRNEERAFESTPSETVYDLTTVNDCPSSVSCADDIHNSIRLGHDGENECLVSSLHSVSTLDGPHIERKQQDKAVEAIPQMAAHFVETGNTAFKSSGTDCSDLGWPSDVDPKDGEAVARWRKKTEREERYISTTLRLGEIVEKVLKQNNALDIYQDFFFGSQIPNFDPPGLATMTSLYTDSVNDGTSLVVQELEWLSGPLCQVATAIIDGGKHCSEGICFLYDVQHSSFPASSFRSFSPLLCLAHNLHGEDILAAGQGNGQLAIFDLRESSEQKTLHTEAQISHSCPVKGVAWRARGSQTEVMTTGQDGEMIWWDIRRMDQRLCSTIPTNDDDSAYPMLPSCLEYNARNEGLEYIIGTSQGTIFLGQGGPRDGGYRTVASCTGHQSTVKTVSRNPRHSKYFLSSDDSTTMIWDESLSEALISVPHRSGRLAAGAWSPTCASCFYTIDQSGVFEAWDILLDKNEPILSLDLLIGPCTCMKLHSTSGYIGIGCQNGTTAIYRPTGSLLESQGSELVSNMLDHEAHCKRNSLSNSM